MQTMLRKKDIKYNHNYLAYFVFIEPYQVPTREKQVTNAV